MRTTQEAFWTGTFGDDYISRNEGDRLLASKIAMFSRILEKTHDVKSVRELGANVGLNIRALSTLLPAASFQAIEINEAAYEQLRQIPAVTAVNGTLYDPFPGDPVDLAFTCGVLIHLEPKMLPVAYARLHEASRRYIMVSEYYSPSPVEIAYRGHTGFLFKRDFAGDLLEAYPDLSLVNYGFVYRRDPVFPGDDLTWFLLEKR